MESRYDGGQGSALELTVGPGRVEAADGYEDRNDTESLETRYAAGNSSASGAVANFVNTIVGTGIIGLPFALAQSGLWAGVFLICLAGLLNIQSTNMLIRAGEKAGRLNYEELMADLFGTPGLHAFSVFAGVFAFGCMSSYVIVVGDTIPEILLASGITTGALADRNSVIVLFGVFIILPVSLLKDLSKLSVTSFVSVTADLLLTGIVVFAGSSEASENPNIDRSEVSTFIRPTVFAGFGAISFAFVCQHSSFMVYRSMAKKGVERWACVTRWSVSIALLMGLTLALGGYLHFVNETQGNILNNFSTEHKAASVARAFLAVTMVFTYPVEMYVARHVLDVSVFRTILGKGPITSARHYGITVVIWSFTIMLSLATDDLGSILEIFGAFGASVIGYTMPALLHLKSNEAELRLAAAVWRKDSPEYAAGLGERLWAIRKFYVPMFMVVFGCVATVAGVATAVVSELSPTKA